MKERTKKLIIELHQATYLFRSLEIEKEFPELFKDNANGWYKDKKNDWCMFLENGIIKYGFDAGGFWREDLSSNYELRKGDYKATDKEVEQALIKEAKKRGFKEGVVADLTYCGHRNSRAKILNKNYRYNGSWLSVDGFIIFENGKWAEIIKKIIIKEIITKEQAEKELGKTIIN